MRRNSRAGRLAVFRTAFVRRCISTHIIVAFLVQTSACCEVADLVDAGDWFVKPISPLAELKVIR
jgi:hypothetical protein